MNTRIYLLAITLLFVLGSCRHTPSANQYELKEADKTFSFRIADDVKLPQSTVFQYTDGTGEYISFQHDRNRILIYNIHSGQLVTDLQVELEGDNGIPGGFMGYYIRDLNHIFIPSLYTQQIVLMDSTATIRQRIDFSKTEDGGTPIPSLLKSEIQMQCIDGAIYLPQLINPMYEELMMEKSRTCVYIDTLNNVVRYLPMKFPPLITYKDRGTSAGFGANYSRCFDGEHFIYSFFSSETMYKASITHEEIEEIPIKSRYIDKVEVLRMKSTQMNEVVHAMCEHPSYGNIVYDKYRKVYYRFAYPKSTLEAGLDPFNIYSSGRKVFSIMILDENLNVVGETLLPEYTYNANLYFVLEDGLYLSTSHIKNPGYSDDVLTFRRIALEKISNASY